MVPIELKLVNETGSTFYEDHFEWDILSELNK